MAVPTTITDLSATIASNSPAGSDVIGTTLDDFFRAHAGIIRRFATNSTVASATTTDIGAVEAEYLSVSGTTTITGLGTIAAGIRRVLVFEGALTFTHNATSLILPGGANITTAAGDVAIMRSLGSGNWRCENYAKASGAPVTGGGSGDFLANGTVPMTGSLTLGGAGTGIIFEGTTADAFETTLVAGEPTADRTVTLPDATTTLAGLAVAQTFTAAQTFDSDVILTGAGKGVTFEGTTANAFETTLLGGEPTADRTINLPDKSGTVVIGESATTSGLTMNTSRLLGRTTASSGAIEEITVGSGLSLSAGSLTATGGASALTLISTQTAASSASIAFTGLTSTYEAYLIVITDYIHGTDNTQLQIRTSTDNGSTYDSGANNYFWMSFPGDSAGANRTGSTTATSIILNGSDSAYNCGTAAGESLSGMIMLANPLGTAVYKQIRWELCLLTQNGSLPCHIRGMGVRAATSDVDAIQFISSSGNLGSGKFRLYGISAS